MNLQPPKSVLKFLIDHNIPKSVGVFLKKQNFDIKLVKDINIQLSDLDLIKLAKQENRIILSNDKDFISLNLRYPTVNMILFSLNSQNAEIRIQAIQDIIPKIKLPFGIIIIK